MSIDIYLKNTGFDNPTTSTNEFSLICGVLTLASTLQYKKNLINAAICT